MGQGLAGAMARQEARPPNFFTASLKRVEACYDKLPPGEGGAVAKPAIVDTSLRHTTSITLLSLDRVAHTSGFNDKHRMGKMPMPRGTGVPPVRIGFAT